MGLFSKLSGVVGSLFQIGGPAGPLWKNNSGALEARNSSDSAFAIARGLDPVGSNDLVTLGYLAANAAAILDVLLSVEPWTTTNYATTYAGNQLAQETWTRNPGNLLKSIAYTYTGQRLTQEVRSIYATDGTTLLARVTIVLTYSGTKLASATYTRSP